MTTTPDSLPQGCFWFVYPDGTLCLAPACMARIQDPDAECLCEADYDVILIDCPPNLGISMDAAAYYGRRRPRRHPATQAP